MINLPVRLSFAMTAEDGVVFRPPVARCDGVFGHARYLGWVLLSGELLPTGILPSTPFILAFVACTKRGRKGQMRPWRCSPGLDGRDGWPAQPIGHQAVLLLSGKFFPSCIVLRARQVMSPGASLGRGTSRMYGQDHVLRPRYAAAHSAVARFSPLIPWGRSSEIVSGFCIWLDKPAHFVVRFFCARPALDGGQAFPW